jgi:phenylalanyl-tRNA synthetase alpha chain
VLRTHTSAHQNDLLRSGETAFLATGDCYRRDEIDATHYPVFHQMEGVRIWPKGNGVDTAYVVDDLKRTLSGLATHLFGAGTPVRWVDAFFPFTEPSLELEVQYAGKWLEVLGCGAVHSRLLAQCGLSDRLGWAFGIGLERLAMVLHDIPDIRLFWTEDERFSSQFATAQPNDRPPVRFRPFADHPAVWKDVSFWVSPGGESGAGETFHENDLYSVVRDAGGDLIESVRLVDRFSHPKTARTSTAYRITYRHLSRALTNAEIDTIQFDIRNRLKARKDLELR